MDRLGERVRVVPLEAADVLLREAAPSAPIVADFAVPTLLLVDQPDAAFVRAALAAGAAGVVLYTDLANPTSNSVYRVLGYAPVCEMVRYEFADGPATNASP